MQWEVARQRKRQPRRHADQDVDIDTPEFSRTWKLPVTSFRSMNSSGTEVRSSVGGRQGLPARFSFYNDYPVAHSGKYGTTPVYFDGGMEIALMNGFDHFTNKVLRPYSYALLYDRLNNRLLSVYGFVETPQQVRRVPRVESARRCVREAGIPIRSRGTRVPDVADLGTIRFRSWEPASPMLRSALPLPRPVPVASFETDGKYYLLSFDCKMNGESSVSPCAEIVSGFPETRASDPKVCSRY